MKKILPLILILVFLLSSCISSGLSSLTGGNSEPDWINNHAVKGKKSAVGSCGPHIRGVNFQKEEAQRRAIDILANQLGVKVSSIYQSVQTSSGAGMSVKKSDHEVTGNVVKATVKATWMNPETKVFFVWMVAE